MIPGSDSVTSTLGSPGGYPWRLKRTNIVKVASGDAHVREIVATKIALES